MSEIIIIVYVKFVDNLTNLFKKRLSRDIVRKITSGMRLKTY